MSYILYYININYDRGESSKTDVANHINFVVMLKEGNYTIVQNISNTTLIFYRGNANNYTYDAAFSTGLATSAFNFENFDYINYSNRTIMLIVNGSHYFADSFLTFSKPYNLTTVILQQNSFAY